MCIAMPGKILSMEGNRAQVDFSGNIVEINTGLVMPQVGQYVLVHAGCAIEVMDREKAEELVELFADMEGM